jgi:sphinganine-1-phosphate aldolase
MKKGISSIPGLRVIGAPVMSCLAFGADGDAIDVYVLGDLMQEKGWRMDRQQNPASLHLTVSPAHDAVAAQFVTDLAACAAAIHGKKVERQGAAAMYGMLGELPDRAVVKDALLDFMDGMG